MHFSQILIASGVNSFVNVESVKLHLCHRHELHLKRSNRHVKLHFHMT